MPCHLWDYALVWCAEIFPRTYNNKTKRTGLECLTGDTPSISEWLTLTYMIRSGFGIHHKKRKIQDPAAGWVYFIELDQLSVTGSLIIREMSSLTLLCSM